jgi:hypothetical protein
MTSFCFVFIDVIVLLCKEHECRSCGSVEDCELSEDAGVNGSVSELRGFCCWGSECRRCGSSGMD